MSEREWKPKVGDLVMVIGHPSFSGRGRITSQIGLQPEWFWIAEWQRVHIRNLDPVLEDERKGAPRPPIKNGDAVEVFCRVVAGDGYATIQYEQLRLDSPRVRQIERRGPNLGREARKS